LQVAHEVLVVTAGADGQTWASEIGAAGYLAKPFPPAQLLAAVERPAGAENGVGNVARVRDGDVPGASPASLR
jgi:DNA-binding response OmpR family regulator